MRVAIGSNYFRADEELASLAEALDTNDPTLTIEITPAIEERSQGFSQVFRMWLLEPAEAAVIAQLMQVFTTWAVQRYKTGKDPRIPEPIHAAPKELTIYGPNGEALMTVVVEKDKEPTVVGRAPGGEPPDERRTYRPPA